MEFQTTANFFAPSRCIKSPKYQLRSNRIGLLSAKKENTAVVNEEEKRKEEIKKQEEKLKFIDSLLTSNDKSKFLVNNYDFRNDITKFMIAKEKIVNALVSLKPPSADMHLPFPFDVNFNNEQINASQMHNIEKRESNFDIPAFAGDESIMLYQNEIIEPELLDMYNQVNRVLYKSPGNFDIISTHHTKPSYDFQASEVPHRHVLLPKPKDVKSVTRPKTTGIFSQ